MDVPEIRFSTTADDVRIAYQDFGEGPPVVLVLEVGGHLEGLWEFDTVRRVFERLGANLRVLVFDHRGTGLSDGFVDLPSLSDRGLDIEAVMVGAQVERASLSGFGTGAQIAVGFAAARPAAIERLALINPRVGESARARALELNPLGARIEEEARRLSQSLRDSVDDWGVRVRDSYVYFSPSLEKDPDELARFVRFQRMVGSRDAIRRAIESIASLDVVEVAPSVAAATQILHTAGNRFHHVGYARALAELIPDCTLVEVEGDDDWYWVADNWQDIVDAHIGFLAGTPAESPLERRFAVVLFTDIAGSSATAVQSGDAEWRRTLDVHDRISNRIIASHGGEVVKTTGDGLLATFAVPSRAVEAAAAMRSALAEAGVTIRAGLHGGEIQLRGEDIVGTVVNVASRVEGFASEGEIVVTSTVKEMLIGSHLSFESAGRHQFKGFEGDWDLYRLVDQ